MSPSQVTVTVNGNVQPLQNSLHDVFLDFQNAMNNLHAGVLTPREIAMKSARGGTDVWKKIFTAESRQEQSKLNAQLQKDVSEKRKLDFIAKENLRQEHRLQIKTFENLGKVVSQFTGPFINTAAAVKLLGIGVAKFKNSKYYQSMASVGRAKYNAITGYLGNTQGNTVVKGIAHPLQDVISQLSKFAFMLKLVTSTGVQKLFAGFGSLQSSLAGKSPKNIFSGIKGIFEDVKSSKYIRKNASGLDIGSQAFQLWEFATGKTFSDRSKEFATNGVFKTLFKKPIGGMKGLLGKAFGLAGSIGKFMGTPAGTAVKGGAMALLGAPLMAMFKVGKKVTGYFLNIAKSAETVQKLAELIALPFKLIFTLGAIPMLTAFIPILKEMLGWITNNQETIQAIGDSLARIFQSVLTPETIGIVTKLLNGFAEVMAFLGMKLEQNFKSVNMNSVASFIATTITALVGFVQDCLIGLVQWCYSAEGQAFIVSMAEGIGKLIGSLVVLVITMLPVFLEIILLSVAGIFEGVITTIIKMLATVVDNIDKATGGALTGLANGIISVVNWFIDRINSVASLFSAFNGGWQLGHVQAWDTGSVGTNFSNAATNLGNTMTISNLYSIVNNNSLTSDNAIKSLLSTGGY